MVLSEAVVNVMPLFLLNNKRIGQRVIIRPLFLLSEDLKKSLGIKWMIFAASNRPGDFTINLSKEILDAFHNRGAVKKKQSEIHRIALNNKSNLKFRW